jgi:hypothetical protein
MLGKPHLDPRRVVGAVVVDEEMPLEGRVERAIDAPEKADERLGAVARRAFADDEAGLYIEGGEQRRRAVLAEPCRTWARV